MTAEVPERPPGEQSAAAGGRAAQDDAVKSDSDVWVHIYHCDAVTGFLNQAWLAAREIGIYHAGVEIFGEEWSFQYFEDTWSDPSISGLIRCKPKEMGDYDYQESINLGATPLSRHEVRALLLQMRGDWAACTYHLTRRNCLTFAEVLTGRLQAPQPFPQKLRSILDASNNNRAVDAMVDYSWSWLKWWMMRKHRVDEEEDRSASSSGCSQDHHHQDATSQGFWSFMLHPTSACSPNSVCLAGGANRSRAEPDVLEGDRPVPAPGVESAR